MRDGTVRKTNVFFRIAYSRICRTVFTTWLLQLKTTAWRMLSMPMSSPANSCSTQTVCEWTKVSSTIKSSPKWNESSRSDCCSLGRIKRDRSMRRSPRKKSGINFPKCLWLPGTAMKILLQLGNGNKTDRRLSWSSPKISRSESNNPWPSLRPLTMRNSKIEC